MPPTKILRPKRLIPNFFREKISPTIEGGGGKPFLIIPLEAPLVPLEVFSVHANPLPETFWGVIWLRGVQPSDYF